jgi:hypothetical protein
MRLRVAIALVCSAVATAATQPTSTVADVINLVRDAVAKHEPDGALAKALHKIKPAEKLDDRTVEELESAGAGPKSVAELGRLRDASQALPSPAAPPAFPHPAARPAIEEQRRMINAGQEIAVNYAKSLPDFICTEVVRRHDDSRAAMDLRDTLEIKLSYFDQREEYRLLTVNGRPTIRPFESVGGATSQGEFGSMLFSIFSGESKTKFMWDHWTTLRKREAHVFSFRILPENSNYHLRFGQNAAYGKADAVVGQHGFIYMDRETNQILRIIADADPPPHFPVQQSSVVLDYDFRDVGGREFLLPVRAEIRMSAGALHTRNLIDFHDYRKFTGESTITFH